MAKSPEQLDRAAEFWDRHLAQPYIIDDKSLSLLSGTINALEDKDTFSLSALAEGSRQKAKRSQPQDRLRI